MTHQLGEIISIGEDCDDPHYIYGHIDSIDQIIFPPDCTFEFLFCSTEYPTKEAVLKTFKFELEKGYCRFIPKKFHKMPNDPTQYNGYFMPIYPMHEKNFENFNKRGMFPVTFVTME